MIRRRLLLVLLASASMALQQEFLRDEWESFKAKNGKKYTTGEEEERRKCIFEKNLELIIQHNKKYAEGNVTYKLAMNHFGDMLPSELTPEVTFPPGEGDNLELHASQAVAVNITDLPDEVDWRKKGAVTPVPDQGSCLSSYAFSAIGALESQQFLKTTKLIPLSAQNVVDCGAVFHNRNCDGGYMDSTYGYIKINGGIDSEESYPYVGVKSDCAFDPAGVAATVSSFVSVRSATELTLMTKLATVGPVCAFVDNRLTSFILYSEGVYHDPNCAKDTMNHAVLIVGYGATEKGEKYWIVRNSWGTQWGQGGYILIRRDSSNECGIASFITYPFGSYGRGKGPDIRNSGLTDERFGRRAHPGVMKQPGLMTQWWIVVCFTATAALLANAADMDDLWISFKLKYNKTYASLLEDQQRKRAFVLNSWKIGKHNEKYARRQITYALAVNEFADMLPGEKKNENIYKSIYDPRKRFQDHELSSPPVNISELPVKFDWRDKGAVTPVRTQGTCLATWAFSAVGAVESHNYIKTEKLVELSEQNLIDCSQDFGNLGCEGGRVDQAFEYIIHNGGIDLEQLYPFVEKTMPCTFDRGAVGAKISKYNTVPQGSEKQLQSIVATLGPVAVAVDASNDDFFQYDQGIYNNPLCSSTNVNYALLVVGYGTIDGKDYWICKNSMGPEWGEHGYIRIARNVDNMCGIATMANYPEV
ncbi:uncharacterized protein LOC144097780 [Amblyomma americanum]